MGATINWSYNIVSELINQLINLRFCFDTWPVQPPNQSIHTKSGNGSQLYSFIFKEVPAFLLQYFSPSTATKTNKPPQTSVEKEAETKLYFLTATACVLLLQPVKSCSSRSHNSELHDLMSQNGSCYVMSCYIKWDPLTSHDKWDPIGVYPSVGYGVNAA